MNKIITDSGQTIDIDTLNLLSTSGSEVVVYNDESLVYKIFRDNYKFTHKTAEQLDYLSSLNTSRILMPMQKLFRNNKLVGFTMRYMPNGKKISTEPMSHLLDELLIIQRDVEIISEAGVRLIDIDKSNHIYNGGIYLIDFGNYKINENKDMFYNLDGKLHFVDNDNHCMVPIDNFENPTIQFFIKKWNYSKINSLLYEMLFMDNPNVDFYCLRKSIDFFRWQRKLQGELYDMQFYKQYFDKKLTVGGAVKKFIKENISIDEKEKADIMSLMDK